MAFSSRNQAIFYPKIGHIQMVINNPVVWLTRWSVELKLTVEKFCIMCLHESLYFLSGE
jgi:hypothetical protein